MDDPFNSPEAQAALAVLTDLAKLAGDAMPAIPFGPGPAGGGATARGKGKNPYDR